jgi:acid stress-induced BolA-like protein IbaG/YrbA
MDNDNHSKGKRMFTDTKTYQRVSAQNATRAYEYLAALEREERELQNPWPAIDYVTDVTVRGDGKNVIIDIGSGMRTWRRIRRQDAAVAEIVGFAARSTHRLVVDDSTPADVQVALGEVTA